MSPYKGHFVFADSLWTELPENVDYVLIFAESDFSRTFFFLRKGTLSMTKLTGRDEMRRSRKERAIVEQANRYLSVDPADKIGREEAEIADEVGESLLPSVLRKRRIR